MRLYYVSKLLTKQSFCQTFLVTNLYASVFNFFGFTIAYTPPLQKSWL